MEIGFSGEGGANLIFVCGMAGLVAVLIYFYIWHKRGVDVTQIKFQLKALIGFGFLFVLFPLCLTELSPVDKIIGSIFSLGGGLLNFYGIDNAQKKIMKVRGGK